MFRLLRRHRYGFSFSSWPWPHALVERNVWLGQGIKVQGPDGSVARIVAGPRGRGLRVTVSVKRAPAPRGLPAVRDDGSIGRGRPPSKETASLRRLLLSHKRLRQVKAPSFYVGWLGKRGRASNAAKQIVRREMIRILGRKQRPHDAVHTGRKPSPAAQQLRRVLASQSAVDPPANYMPLVLGFGLSKRAARAVISRELRRATKRQ